jgi:Ala-tRNA(Pro) deacylase
MPATPETLFAYLDQLGVAHATVEHPPFHTVDEGRAWHRLIPGLHCKNLFLKARDGSLFLVLMPGDKRARLNLVEKRLGRGRLSFGKPELLMDALGLAPGSVTPFGLLNDSPRRVSVVVDADLASADSVNFHPLHNAASTTLATSDLLRFVRSLGYDPLIIDCG